MTKIKYNKIKFILGCFLVVFSIGIIGEASAATYYVAINGLDSNNGSISSPWATFNYAISRVSVGDTLIAKAGTYNQTINVNKSNITIKGELDANGNRLSIIDPSDLVSGWQLAPEIGTGVYKTTNIGYEPYAISIHINGTPYKVQKILAAWNTELAKAPDALYTGCGTCLIQPDYWDGIEVLFSTNVDATTTYISFRDDDNPSSYTIRSAPNTATIYIAGKSYVTIKDLEIRAANYGIQTTADGATQSSYITIDNNKIVAGRRQMQITGNYHTISNNIVTSQEYAGYKGYIRGTWICDEAAGNCDYDVYVNGHVYQDHKYKSDNGDGSREAGGIILSTPNTGVKIFGNEVYATDEAISPTYGTNWKIYNNVIHNTTSLGIYVTANSGNSSIHDNLFYETNQHIRFTDMDNTNSNIKIYNNRFWQKPNQGRHLFFMWDSLGGTQGNIATLWFYHNSFSGGDHFYQSNHINDWGYQGMNNMYFINNIISSLKFDGAGDPASYHVTTNGFFGECSYNWISGTNQAVWCDSTNVKNGTTLMWSSPTLHDFTPASSAVGKGIDVSQTFLGYSALPGFTTGYFSGSRPNIGVGESTLNTQTCTSFTYSDWGTCQSNNTQTRTVTSSSPSGCTGGNPVLTQSCTYDSGTPALTILKSTSTPTIDGNLTEYNNANSITFSPTSGGNTVTVKSLWTSEALYLGINVTDTQLNASATTRDGSLWSDDSVEWFIDTYYDGGGSSNPDSAYMKVDDYQGIVNILNTKYDSQGTTSGTPTSSWNGTWQSAVKLSGTANTNTDTDTGYSMEIKIPWTSIGYSSAPSADIFAGMSFAVNDKDAGGVNSKMWLSSASSNQNASNWQRISLSGTLATVDVTPPAAPVALMIQ